MHLIACHLVRAHYNRVSIAFIITCDISTHKEIELHIEKGRKREREKKRIEEKRKRKRYGRKREIGNR